MDVARVFNNLREWKRGLTTEESALLVRLMEIKNSKGFSDISVEDVRKIQEQMLHSDEDVGRVDEVKRAANNLKPTYSDIGFI
jgi:hypothetical protein